MADSTMKTATPAAQADQLEDKTPMTGTSKSKTSGPKNPAKRPNPAVMTIGGPGKPSQAPPAAEPPQSPDVIDESKNNLKAFIEANEAVVNAMGVLNAEIVEFGNRRFRENLERSRSLMACEDAEEAMRVEANFFQSAAQHYLDQTSSMMTVMSKMAEDFWSPLQKRTKEALQDPEKKAP